jgi:ketosteroid isomerase-like protein
MSEENVEIVRRGFEAINRGDIEGAVSYADPDSELHSAIVGSAEGNVYRGHDGLRQWFAEVMESFEELRTELTEFRDLGDRVVAFGHIHARGRESGLELDAVTGWVVTVRNGKVLRAEGYLSYVEALEAAGLREWAMSEQNVELVRNLAALGGPLSLTPDQIDGAFREYLDEEFELRLPPDYPEGELVFRGRDGMNRVISMLRDTWREWRFEPERFLDAGDRVVVFARLVAEGEASGAPIELETTHVWTIHAGRAVSMDAYRDRSEALEAAGLSE